MGANCFKAELKDKIPPGGTGTHAQVSQNRHSSPLFRWDNRTHIEDIMPDASSPMNPPHISSFNGSEIINVAQKIGPGSPGMKVGNFGKFSQLIEQDNNSSPSTSSQEAASKFKQENLANSSTEPHAKKASSSNTRSEPWVKTSFSKSSSSQKKSIRTQQQISPTISKSHLPQISKQISPDRWNPDANHWTCQTFNELVASSQRAKSPFNNQTHIQVDYIRADTSAFFSCDSRTTCEQLSCNICTNSLKEKSPVGRRKIWSDKDLITSAVLDCGHVFHDDCLEKLTPEIDMYDPECPVCMFGMRHVTKMLGKTEAKMKKESKDKKPMLEGLFSADKLKSYSVNGSLSKISFVNRNHASNGSRTPFRSFSHGDSSEKNLVR